MDWQKSQPHPQPQPPAHPSARLSVHGSSFGQKPPLSRQHLKMHWQANRSCREITGLRKKGSILKCLDLLSQDGKGINKCFLPWPIQTPADKPLWKKQSNEWGVVEVRQSDQRQTQQTFNTLDWLTRWKTNAPVGNLVGKDKIETNSSPQRPTTVSKKTDETKSIPQVGRWVFECVWQAFRWLPWGCYFQTKKRMLLFFSALILSALLVLAGVMLVLGVALLMPCSCLPSACLVLATAC